MVYSPRIANNLASAADDHHKNCIAFDKQRFLITLLVERVYAYMMVINYSYLIMQISFDKRMVKQLYVNGYESAQKNRH